MTLPRKMALQHPPCMQCMVAMALVLATVTTTTPWTVQAFTPTSTFSTTTTTTTAVSVTGRLGRGTTPTDRTTVSLYVKKPAWIAPLTKQQILQLEEEQQSSSLSIDSTTAETEDELFESNKSSQEAEDDTLLTSVNVASGPLLDDLVATDTLSDSENDDDDEAGRQPLPENLLTLPRHSHEGVNRILKRTEHVLRALNQHAKKVELQRKAIDKAKEVGRQYERVFANNYVDLAKVDTVGFDFDYTLVTYTEELLDLLYDMALKRLVNHRQYPMEMLDAGLRYDPYFSIRGLAVDKETGWICHLSYTHKVAVAWEGREKLPTSRIYAEYRGKRGLRPNERRKRLKPLNDLFSMAECCLIADTIQFFKDRNIPYCPQNAVTDVLSAIRETHISGDFHRLVANNPDKYFNPTPHLEQVLHNLKESGKRLIFVSNSPFWYVDAGMRYIFGNDWRDSWDAIITSAGKPHFYTDENRPFREICLETRRLMFRKVERFEQGKVYTEGCLRELTRLMDWKPTKLKKNQEEHFGISSGSLDVATANVLYIGDSLFADLVDAKREFSWTTAAVTPEVGFEMEVERKTDFTLCHRSLDLLLNALRLIQEEWGTATRTDEDMEVLDGLERLVSVWRDRETMILGNPFGSVFRARYQPSLFAHSLRRYCDLYMTSVSSLRHYSPQHRFYPERDHRLLAHEISGSDPECWTLDDVMLQEDDEHPAETA